MTEPTDTTPTVNTPEGPVTGTVVEDSTPEKSGVDFIDNLEQDCEHCLTAVNDFFHAVARNLGLSLPSHTDHVTE